MIWTLQLVISIGVLLFSVILHEVAHGYVALERGDRTARDQGRLTLNPLAHIDLYGTILVPLILAILGAPVLGWAKPVPVRPSALHHPRHDWMMVSLAGPVTNLGLALLAAIPFRLGLELPALLGYILLMVVVINVELAAFNLIPLPPLDGSRVVMRFLPPKLFEAYLRLESIPGYLFLYLLVAFGIVSHLIDPIVTRMTTNILGI